MTALTDEIRKKIKEHLTAVPKPKSRENVQRRTSAGLWARPFKSESLGVGPDQISEAQATLKQHGLNIDFTKDGRAIITSEKQYREVAKACGLWDGRNGYGGYTPEGHRDLTGRDRIRRREEFERRVLRGDFDAD